MMSRALSRLAMKFGGAMALLGILLALLPIPAAAREPTPAPASVYTHDNCGRYLDSWYDTEYVIKGTLLNEWTGAGTIQGYKAGAAIIRTDVWYYGLTGQTLNYFSQNSPTCSGAFYFVPGSGNATTNAQVDNTHSVVVASNLNSSIAINFLGFGSDLQNWQNNQTNHDFQYLIRAGYAAGNCNNCIPAVPASTPLTIVSAYDAIAVVPSANGYRIADFEGNRYAYGNPTPALYSGSFPSNRIAVDLKNSSYYNGYWMLSQNGEIYSFNADYLGGANQYTGSCAGARMAVTPSGRGYLIVCGAGSVFNFGDSQYEQGIGLPAGCGGLNCAPGGPYYVVDVAITPSNNGYWIMTTDGAIFTFGDAGYYGTYGGCGGLNCLSGGSDAARSFMPSADGGGYLIVDDGGTVYNFGDAQNVGDLNYWKNNGTIAWFATTGASFFPSNGYEIMGADNVWGDGGVWCFGSAVCYGDGGT